MKVTLWLLIVPLISAVPPQFTIPLEFTMVGPTTLPARTSFDCVRKPETKSDFAGAGYSCDKLNCQLPVRVPPAPVELKVFLPPQAVNANIINVSDAVARIFTDLSRSMNRTSRPIPRDNAG